MKYYNHQKKSKGFTLIELLVVISIISLLSSAVLASLSSARTKATKTAFVQNVKEFQTALEVYKNSTGIYPSEDPSGGYGFTESSASSDITDYLKSVNFIPNNISKFPSILFSEDSFMYATGLSSDYSCGSKVFTGFILIYFNTEGSGGINLPAYAYENVPVPGLYCITGN